MIRVGTFLNVVDNSGARRIACIRVLSGYRRRYAVIGNVIVVSVKSLRSKRRISSKVKKGSVHRALIVRTKVKTKAFVGDSISFCENSAVLLNPQNKMIGTRIFGAIPKLLRYTKFLRVASVSSGLIS